MADLLSGIGAAFDARQYTKARSVRQGWQGPDVVGLLADFNSADVLVSVRVDVGTPLEVAGTIRARRDVDRPARVVAAVRRSDRAAGHDAAKCTECYGTA